MMCVKLTEPASRATTDVNIPNACMMDIIKNETKSDWFSEGLFTIHRGRKRGSPTINCKVDTIAGRGTAFRAFLFATLYTIVRKYQRNINQPNFRDFLSSILDSFGSSGEEVGERVDGDSDSDDCRESGEIEREGRTFSRES